ncbi:MAG: response regulator [Alphaproteobacteria bacterium]|nr:response regulator [Alphaproteobacteria bacterium]
MPKILLVEDNEMNRDMLSRRLRRRDYEVELAVDGQEAVDKTKASRPDIILLDMSLPVKDGWTVAQELKADSGLSGIPIIALTAHAMVGDREKALAAGCDEYETKPIDFKRLVGKIEDMLKA